MTEQTDRRRNEPTPVAGGGAGDRVAAVTAPGRTSRLVLVASVTAAIGGLLFGYDTGVISSSLIFIQKQFHLSALEQGMIASALAVGAVIGAVGCGPLADRFGRKPTILTAAGVFAVGGILAALSPDALVLAGARVVIGLSVGAASVLVPLFIAEIAPPASRGRLVVVNQLMITIGILVSYLIGYLLTPIQGWRWMFAFACIPAALLAAGMLTLPETPRWLITRDRMGEARDILLRLRGGVDVEQAVAEEVDEIRQARAGGAGRWRDVVDHRVRRLLFIGLGVQFLAQLTGVNAVIYYTPTVLTHGGLGAAAATLATVGVGVVNVVMTIVGMALIDRSGRRPLLLWGLGFMVPALVVLGIILGSGALHGAGVVIAIVCLLVYIAAVAVSVDTIVFVIPSEIYPLRVRGKAMGATLVMNWGMNFVISLSFLPVMKMIGGRWTFWMFAVLCVVMWLFTKFILPETKGRSLEELETVLSAR